MTFNELKNKKSFKILTNRYLLIFIIFSVWMLFFDENSYLVDREFNEEIEKLEIDKNYYQTEIKSDKQKIEQLQDPEKLDQFAREKYHMKKENEDIFIIEYDTIDD